MILIRISQSLLLKKNKTDEKLAGTFRKRPLMTQFSAGVPVVVFHGVCYWMGPDYIFSSFLYETDRCILE